MEIKHEILSFDPISGGLVVRYYADEFAEGLIFNIDLPVQENKFPETTELDALIALYAPRGQLERAAQIKNCEIPTSLTRFIAQGVVRDDLQVRTALIRTQRNDLLLASDYTQLPDTPLTDIERRSWAEYRQMLRDITKQESFPDSVVWPISPAEEPQ